MIFHADFHNWFWLVVTILSVWRVAALICYEAGPFDILSKFRRVLYKLHLGKVVECFHCMALWVAAAVVLCAYRPGFASIVLVLAIAGGASIAERFLK